MTTPNTTPTPQPHTPGQLLRSTLIAAAVAVVILVTIVLPAEYGIDPTGIGRPLGLTRMGEIKRALAAEAAADTTAPGSVAASAPASGAPTADSSASGEAARAGGGTSASVSAGPGERADVTEVVLAPAQAREVKLVMQKDSRVSYSWATNRGVVNYDTHGDRPGTRYHGYSKGTATPKDEGVLTAAFDGQHGWFWRNRGTDTVRVTLRTRGTYDRVVHVQ